MRLQILNDVDNRYLGRVLSFLCRNAGQFGSARAFHLWAKKHSSGLVRFLEVGESHTVYLFDASQPGAAAIAVCQEDEWTLGPGLGIHCGGQHVCSLTRPSANPGAASSAEMDRLARRIVALLNEKGATL